MTFRLVFNKVLHLVSLAVLCISCSGDVKLPGTNCDDIFSMQLSGFVDKDVCSNEVLDYKLNDNNLRFVIESTEVSGKLHFEIKLDAYHGAGQYTFADGSSYCQMTVYGASDEFYKCVKGKIDVREATRQKLLAEFDVMIEGFYNKKTIHARGGIHL
ncbi:MAG: hypothetical protein Q8S18_14000 [Bacteroidales bacterium]|nr:hypothetical protein [Bacteroidales bacterium]